MKTYEIPKPGNGNGYPTTTVIDLTRTVPSYRLKALCLNCGWEGQIRLPRGTDKGWLTTNRTARTCFACGCSTLEGGTLTGHDTEEDNSVNHLAEYNERQDQMWSARMKHILA